MSLITEFYLNERPDHKGRFLHDIWQFDRYQQELFHDYIQWLFPLDVPNLRGKPVLTQEDCRSFAENVQIRKNLLRSFDFMLAFWGIERNEIQFNTAKNINKRDNYWIKLQNHNQLRISRVIRCLYLCGFAELATVFRKFVIQVGQAYQINAETLAIWQNIDYTDNQEILRKML
jgi:hypothetical protein